MTVRLLRYPFALLLLGILVYSWRSPSQQRTAPAPPAGKPSAARFRPPVPPSSPLAQSVLNSIRTPGEAPPNDIVVQNLSGSPAKHRPVTVSRFFARGEIPRCPQAVIGGTPVETQCDVKTRWDDGSVKHSILTFFLDLPPSTGLPVHFADQPAPGGPGGLSKEAMLRFLNGAWGARMTFAANTIDGSAPVTVNAREILQKWDGVESENGVRTWLKGPLVTQVIVEDKSPGVPFDFGWHSTLPSARIKDFVNRGDTKIQILPEDAENPRGWSYPAMAYLGTEMMELCHYSGATVTICPGGRGKNGNPPLSSHYFTFPLTVDAGWKKAANAGQRSLHPIFVLTFYRGWPGVKVEYITENIWSNRLQDQVYNLTLYRDEPPVQARPTQKTIHVAAARWREIAWSGQEPPAINIDYNFAYMIHSRAIPSYDASLQAPESAIAAEYANFLESDRGKNMGSATWFRIFPAPGGRPDLALFPRWHVRYLYSFDPRLYEMLVATAEAGAHAPVHFRENFTGRLFCAGSCAPNLARTNAYGRPLSLDARPGLWLPDANYAYADQADLVVNTGNRSTGDWVPDVAHLPDFAYVPYLITGDWYFMEENQFWASFMIANGANIADDCDYCRHHDWGYVGSQEVRSRAWGLRSLGHAALASPDGTPEQQYFLAKLNNNIAVSEGFLGITTGSFHEPCPAGAYDPSSTTRWCWGYTTLTNGVHPNPLFSLAVPSTAIGGYSDEFMWGGKDFLKNSAPPKLPRPDAVPAHGVNSEWMHYYYYVTTGHLIEAGFPQIAELHARSVTRLLGQLRDPGYNPWLVGAYRTPQFACEPVLDPKTNLYVCKPAGYFQNWKDVRNVYKRAADFPGYPNRDATAFDPSLLTNPEGGYPYLAKAAASYLPGIVVGGMNGKDAWDWIAAKVPNQLQHENPMWAQIPRELNPLAASARQRLAKARIVHARKSGPARQEKR